MEEKKYSRYTFILIGLTTLIRLYLAYTIGLGVDEAHYIQYALQPALSYYDHPPMVGYLIRFFIITIGKSLITVRMPAIIAGTGTALMLFYTGKLLYGTKAGFWTVVIFNCIPLFSSIGGIAIVPETILSLFWLIILFLMWQIYLTGKHYLWYLTGIIAGLSLLTKYTAFVIYPSILLFILTVPSMRRWMRKKEPYIGFLISTIMFIPVIIWNYENYWASFIFQFSHGLGEKRFFNIEMFLKNIGAQAGVFSPFIFFFLVYVIIITVRQAVKKDVKALLLTSFSLPVILLFTYSGMSNEVLPHWLAVGYLTILPAAGEIGKTLFSSPSKKIARYFLIVSLVTGGILTILIPVQIISRPFNLSQDIDISQDITGWKDLARRIKEIKIEEKGKDFFVFTHKFYIASQLAYYLEPEVPVYCLSKRIDQYDFWQYSENLKVSLFKRNGIFFCDDHFKTEPGKFYVFQKIEGPEVLPVYQHKRFVKNFYIYRCYNFDTEKTNPSFLQSINFIQRNFKENVKRWNERYFFFINHYACKNKFVDTFFLSLTYIGSGFILIPLIVLIAILKKKKQSVRYIFIFLISLIIGGIIVHILKEIFNIPRPLGYFGKEFVNVLGPPLKKGSFPSGHSQTAFTGVLLLSYLMPEWSILFLILGIFISISRCFVGAHFPLDIIGGFVVAVISFFTAMTLFEKRFILKELYIKHRIAIKTAIYLMLFLYFLFFIIPYQKYPVYTDTQNIAKDIRIIKPLAVRIFTPFTDFPLYFINIPYPKGQILSWFIWLSFIWIIYTVLFLRETLKIKILKILRGMFIILLSLCLLTIYGIFLPVQRYKLIPKSSDTILLDLHSHTIYSHDGIVTPAYNLQWHNNYGFNCWAITEHKDGSISSILQEEIIRRNNLPNSVIPAQEISFKGVYLNLLGIENDINPKEFNNLKELIDKVHSYGGVVIVPHIWADKKMKFSLKEIADAGVDGFEVAGISSVPLTYKKQKEIIELCRNRGLVMVGGTNWHGWNNICTVWTSLKTENWNQLSTQERRKAVIAAIRKREGERFRVMTYYYSYIPEDIIFTPFRWTFSYISSLDKNQRGSWIFWTVLLYLSFAFVKNRRRVITIIWFLITILLFLKSLYFFELWNEVKIFNDILPDLSKGLILISLITLLLGITNIKRR
ncbi:MAG: glycosyltransferase family 39 protein [bacterium]|nr:glycosyltransferase family 39 protein [bacterium]